MKLLKFRLLPLLIAVSLVSLQACKSKKKLIKKEPPVAVDTTPAKTTPPPPPAPPVQQEETPAPAPARPDYNFKNIQFEFNSAVLKTESYPILDKAAQAMKQDASVSFVLNGYASAEGTPEHNMELSVERANAVKAYLVNTGVSSSNLSVQGYGEKNPIGSNTTDEGRALNRRVEIRKVN